MIEKPSRENVLPLRSDCGSKRVFTVDKNNFQILSSPMINTQASGTAKEKHTNGSDEKSEEEEEGLLPSFAEFDQARIKALITENESTGMPDMAIAAYLAIRESKSMVKSRKNRTIYKNPTTEDLEQVDRR